ncbi:PPE family protein [Mycobacterium sp. SM1]|uniref:PPE family protein n=1 Tax=Mycobacterium sp. SM1 TaxID=2816243 RepID=UPI001BD07DDD|nr:PPE family protein [Mycobacterium sp. SM1]MBS4726859.1 PPE family protein [Mycobacterium sp. SM1]
MDFALLPPEINSGRMYTGPGSGPMLVAAAAWDTLAAELHSVAAAYESEITGLISGPWLGPAAASMAAAVAPYVAWLRTTAVQAEQTATQARAAAAAYESAFAMTVPPPVIAANRSLLISLIATNFLGQNTPAIAATEADYAEMWAQDAAAMYAYAGASAAASTLTPFTPPAPTTNPAGLADQAAATAHAVSTPAGTAAQTITSSGSQLMAAVPTALQGLASFASSTDPPGLTTFATLVTEVAIVVAGADTVAASFAAPASTFSGSASSTSAAMTYRGMLINADRDFAQGRGPFTGNGPGGQMLPQWILGGPAAFGEPSTPAAPSVAAGLGQGTSLGGLSVPRGWVMAAPAIRSAALALPFTGVSAAPATAAEIAPAMTAGIPGSMVSSTALAGMAGGAIGNTVSPGRRERVEASPPQTRVGPPQRPAGEAVPGISTELRALALVVLRDSGVLTEEEFTEKQRLVGR